MLCQEEKGPVLIDLPINVQKTDINPVNLRGFNTFNKEEYDLDLVRSQISEYLQDFIKADRPVLMIGGGVKHSNAIDDFRELANLLKVPCYPTWNALDVVTSDFEYYGDELVLMEGVLGETSGYKILTFY